MGVLTLEKGILIAADIAKDLLYYGYEFEFFMGYPLTKSIGEEKCRELWNKTKNEMANA